MQSTQPAQPDAGVVLLLGKNIIVHIDGAVYDVSGFGLRFACAMLCRSVMSDSSRPHGQVGILQARILEWVAMPSSRGSSQSRD